MITTPDAADLAPVVEVVKARPGLSRAKVAGEWLRGRRGARLELVERALAAGLVHEGVSYVSIRGGAVRTVRGLYPGPAEELDVQPALDGGRLRADRQRIGVPAGLLAAQLQVSRAQLYRWETGEQQIPPGVELHAALEAAQTALVGARPRRRRRRDAEELRDLLRDVRDNPGRGRYAVARSQRRQRLLEQALAAGQLHEAQTWGRVTRQPVLGVFPGPARPKAQPVRVRVGDLEEARLAAGWSRALLGRKIGEALREDPPAVVAGTTVARWVRECDVVPGWAAEAAADALARARLAGQSRHDRSEAVRAAVAAEPGRSRKALAASLGYTRGNYIDRYLDALIAAGEVHEEHAGRHGVQKGLYPGPAPAVPVLTGERVRQERLRAGRTQRQLVEAGVVPSKQALQNWERGVVPIPPELQRPLLEYLEALPGGVPPRMKRAGLVPGEELAPQVLELICSTGGRTWHQIEMAGLPGSRAELRRAVALLEADGRIRYGRIGAGIPDPSRPNSRASRGRVGYLPATP